MPASSVSTAMGTVDSSHKLSSQQYFIFKILHICKVWYISTSISSYQFGLHTADEVLLLLIHGVG